MMLDVQARCFLLVVLLFVPRVDSWPVQEESAESFYAVVLDAGSSGTRVHVFEYHYSKASPYIAVQLPEPAKKVSPGLSSFATELGDLPTYLAPLLTFAQDQVPQTHIAYTPIYLLATAGLRLLDDRASSQLLLECSKLLSSSGFLFDSTWAKILPGELEGLYAWLAVNYASGALQVAATSGHVRHHMGSPVLDRHHALMGVLEMGGASVQLTFVPHEPAPPAFTQPLSLPGLQLSVYTQSFLGYGLDSAWKTASDYRKTLEGPASQLDPCLPRGFQTKAGDTGAGDFEGCQRLAAALLPADAPCPHRSCSIGSTYTPPLSGRFLATENFFYMTVECLGLAADASLLQLESAARTHCGKNWEQVQQDASKRTTLDGEPIPAEALAHCCFGAAYIWTLLQDAFHLAPTARIIRFRNTVRTPEGNDVTVGWVLGALLMEVANMTLPPLPPVPRPPELLGQSAEDAGEAEEIQASLWDTAALPWNTMLAFAAAACLVTALVLWHYREALHLMASNAMANDADDRSSESALVEVRIASVASRRNLAALGTVKVAR